ncbi:TIGR03749 family integrating conjugative element protein [Pseudomonas synxantha]|uniref:TIGR03749 family integrating conjugative element protein n=1 Tax=Pseudomonas synxantha TaxID=47883 RepID=A0ABS0UPM2_9PSED|nr:TIGR03749 family integrating conjugative element protein [Pseudomonas synxantha]MBI6567554.1 TIGR03749 family integrating conjugative element protein [Pseudomonas synxantha]MBI6582331.1 TIGR03749 family integrating conjugative element protein [Pseudomonas synxantha]MBI6645426.1 TIGR03749 family integrating conjugative element protein [Pseudomonas synxantha]
MTRFLILMLVVAAGWCSAVGAVEVKYWDRLPLAVPLTVGQERVLMLDEDVRVGVPGTIAGKLRVQSVGGTVYLRAAETLPPTRLQLQSVKSGDIILIDIEALEGSEALEPVKIVAQAPTPDLEAAKDTAPAATPVPVVLTRYAAQNLYAPLRTVAPLPGVRRVPLSDSAAFSMLLPTEQVSIKALAAWRLGDYWVTAVKIVNRGPGKVALDPRHLQATLYAATFQHADLGLAGTPEDTTVAYLVTRGGDLKHALLLPPPTPEADDHES